MGGLKLRGSPPAGPAVPSLQAYGHSIINDAGATNARYGILSRLALALGVPAAAITKVALNGGRVADNAANGGVASLLNGQLARDLTAGPYVTRGGLKLCSIGANDNATLSSSGAAGNLVTEAALRLAFSTMFGARLIPWLASTTTLNDGAHSGPLTFSGGWTVLSDNTFSLLPGEAFHNTNGAYVEFTLDANYNGEAITVALVVTSSTDYAAALAVNGVSKVSLDTSAMQPALVTATGLGASGGAAIALRMPPGNAVAGDTIRCTFSDVQAAKFCAGSAFIIEGHDPPPLLLPTAPLHSGDATQIANAGYQKARVAAVAADFPSAAVVDLDALLPGTGEAAGWSGSVAGHPNNLGCEKIAAALISTARGLVTPAAAARMTA